LTVITEKGKTNMMLTAKNNSADEKKFSFVAADANKKGKYLFVSETGDTTVVGNSGEVIVVKTDGKGMEKQAFEFHTTDSGKSGNHVMVFTNDNNGEKHIVKGRKIMITSDNDSIIENADHAVWISKDDGTKKIITITTDGTEEHTIIESDDEGENKNITVFVRKADGAEMTETHEITVTTDGKNTTEKKVIIINDGGKHKKGDKDENVMVWKLKEDGKNTKMLKLKLTGISDTETLKKLGVQQEQTLKLNNFMLNNAGEDKLAVSFNAEKAEKFNLTIFDSEFKTVFTDKTKAITVYNKETTLNPASKGTYYVVVSTKDKSFSLQVIID
ncbi:MAG TPA: hypothetical protein DCQ31_18620, partial [Bacteroidales bacterium]|nr:hypothetical protein [Bacteroidales bacterium]